MTTGISVAGGMRAAGAAAPTAWRGGWRDGLRYGGLGFPLAFLALPLYIMLPHHYAQELGLPLAGLGALLLAARLLDAVTDPWIGRLCDAAFARSTRSVVMLAVFAAGLAAIGFRALFFPPAISASALWLWCGGWLAVTYLGYSLLSVLHQSWGARLGGNESQRAGIVAWREALALAGVLVASVLPSLAGLDAATAVLAVALAVAVALLARAPLPSTDALASARPGVLWLPWRRAAFRRLALIYLVNGIASAVPATLVLFFIRDRLQAAAWEPLFLGLYFAAGAASMPLWLRVVARTGLARAWGIGMLLAVLTFGWAAALDSGDVMAYAVVCAASGVALGADLALPGALLAGVVHRAGDAGRFEGAYFGWWNLATKLNLALAAGITLPLLQVLGYTPGSPGSATTMLAIAYCALPCALKLVALALLRWLWLPHESSAAPQGAASWR